MPAFVLTNAKVYLGGYDLSGDHNRVGLDITADEKDSTVFGNTYRSRVGGLRNFEVAGSGFVQYGAGEPDPVLFDNIATNDVPVTLSHAGAAEGDVAYTGRTAQGSFKTLGQVGEIVPFEYALWGRKDIVRGTVMQSDAAPRTVSGNTTARQLGAVSSSQSAYIALHVVSFSGTTPDLTVSLQSDDATGFPSATERLGKAFGPVTAVQSFFGSVAGPITDQFWRLNYTISGTTPSFLIVGIVGVQ